MRLLRCPRIPESRAERVLISGEYPEYAERLNRLEFQVILTQRDTRLPGPVGYHPDLQCCVLSSENMFVLKNSVLTEQFAAYGISAVETEKLPSCQYPQDVLCSCFVLNDCFIGNLQTVEQAILAKVNAWGYRLIHVKQGYAACSVCIVNQSSVITADEGIASAMERQGFDVLKIRPGHIRLPGYNTGFVGGCCGLIQNNRMVFSGKLETHPDGKLIREFLDRRDITVTELSDGELLDIGGIIPVLEEGQKKNS